MKIVVSGASGLVGTALLTAARTAGDQVTSLVRRAPRGPDEVQWDPAAGRLDPAALAGADAVVHLAGAGVGDHRWTPAYRETVLQSRVQGTSLIASTLAGMPVPPPVLLSASAVGWYGDTGSREVDETAPRGAGFLADVVEQWEAATGPARDAGIRVCHLRSGIVLSTRGGALAKQLPLFKLGLGGRLGSGRQYQSWIGLTDEIAAIRYLLTADHVRGEVNLTAPTPVTNAAFTAALGKALGRPALLFVPGAALKVALGGFATEGVLWGQRAVPAVLEKAGFGFADTSIDTALRTILDRKI